MTFYDLLGVPSTASHAELRRAFVRLARQAHPDVHATADAATRRTAEQRMRELNEAWAVLGDGARRRRYDDQLAAARAASASTSRRQSPAGSRAAGPAAGRPSGGTPGESPGRYGASGPSATDWRRYASPGPALHRSTAARLITMAPPAVLALAALFLGAGALLRATALVSLAGATAVVAALAFLAAPILAMKEARRGQRRPARRPVHHVSGRAHR